MKRSLLLLAKDLLVLARSPVLLGVLIAYPLVIAALIGLTAAYASAKPRVALVDRDHLPAAVVLAGKRFDINREIDAAAKNVRLVRMSVGQARRQLRDGRVVAVITIPPGFLKVLRGLVFSPHLDLEIGRGQVASRVRQQLQALVYALNLRLQRAFIASDLEYVRLLERGGHGQALGNEFTIIGLDGVERLLEELPRGERLDQIRGFVGDARTALSFTDDAIRATANPVRLVEKPERGRTWFLSAQVQAYALAMTITFLALLLAAASIAGERDENVIGRLARGLVSLGQLVWAKVGLAAATALALGLMIAVGFGLVVEIGDVTGGEPWVRLPLVAIGLLIAGASIGAIGALIGGLAREARTASLVAVLVVLPVVFVGLVPREVARPAGWVSDAFPFAHAVRFFSSALFDVSPWSAVGREVAWLLGLGLAYGVLARFAARRLLT